MKGVQRGCGTREQGCAYLEVPLGPHGRPVEDFIVDPPLPVDAAALGLSPVGVKLIEDRGTPGLKHVIDWVGAEHYPNVADFVEEVRRFGASRKVARTSDFSGLGPGSRLYLCHPRAIVENHPMLRQALDEEPCCACPKDRWDHTLQSGVEMCAGLWWRDVEGVERGELVSIRRMPSFAYNCAPRPAGFVPEYRLGLFLSLPIRQVAVIRARDGSHELTETAARQGWLPVVLEDS